MLELEYTIEYRGRDRRGRFVPMVLNAKAHSWETFMYDCFNAFFSYGASKLHFVKGKIKQGYDINDIISSSLTIEFPNGKKVTL